jgi:hypothetical protein
MLEAHHKNQQQHPSQVGTTWYQSGSLDNNNDKANNIAVLSSRKNVIATNGMNASATTLSLSAVSTPVSVGQQPQQVDNNNNNNNNNDIAKYDGVAVTLMLRAPKWFHRRYTAMIHNVFANIPPSWPIQIFSNEEWMIKDVLPVHPGLQLLRSHPRIIWTPLPKELSYHRTKPKEVMKSLWVWDRVVAENVFVFSGNGAVCGNTQASIQQFVRYDFVGVPWGQFYGIGGDGSTHSFRHRSAMIQVLTDHPPLGREMDLTDNQYFVKHMVAEEGKGTDGGSDNEKGGGGNGSSRYRLADRATTYAFGGIVDPESCPFVVSGTQASLNWTVRDALLGVCPELKIIFPSLHEPACFGAHPNGEKCKSSICALQDSIPSHGC